MGDRHYRKRAYGNDDDSGPQKFRQVETGEGIARVVAKHYNDLEEKGKDARFQSKILFLRNCNNWIKSMLIQETVEQLRSCTSRNLVVLDMCCGKGGDIQKWSKSNAVQHVVFADIAETSVEQCQVRYNTTAKYQRNNMFSAEFITADCTRDRLLEKYENRNINFDLVSCQFGLHYSFESFVQVERMLQNVADKLKVGGRFIGTIPNSDRIVHNYRDADSKTFGNSVFEISFDCDEPFPLFGAKYYFKLDEVVNCPEFLVHFPCFEHLASKFGLKLLYKHNFDNYFNLKKRDGEFLLNRMQALEVYPAAHGSNPNDAHEFRHAEEFLRANAAFKSVGTLSKSEWEAISLYTLFAFEKVPLK